MYHQIFTKTNFSWCNEIYIKVHKFWCSKCVAIHILIILLYCDVKILISVKKVGQYLVTWHIFCNTEKNSNFKYINSNKCKWKSTYVNAWPYIYWEFREKMKNYFNCLKVVFKVFHHHAFVKIFKFLYEIAKDKSNQWVAIHILRGHTYIGSGHTYICVAIHRYNRLDIDNI